MEHTFDEINLFKNLFYIQNHFPLKMMNFLHLYKKNINLEKNVHRDRIKSTYYIKLHGIESLSKSRPGYKKNVPKTNFYITDNNFISHDLCTILYLTLYLTEYIVYVQLLHS